MTSTPTSNAPNTGTKTSQGLASTKTSQHLTQQQQEDDALNLDELKEMNKYAESTKSLSFLPMVHERQTQRMKTRSEWFLNPGEGPSPYTPINSPRPVHHQPQISEGRKGLVRRTSSKEKRLVRRSSSKKDKENGSTPGSTTSHGLEGGGGGANYPSECPGVLDTGACIAESDYTEFNVPSFNVTLTYKPRI